jgi:hypothetical protein
MNQIILKNGKVLKYDFMKSYINNNIILRFKDKINKKSVYVKSLKLINRTIPELIDLVEKVFGENGIIFMFLQEYVSKEDNSKTEKFIKELVKKSKQHKRERRLKITFFERIKFFFGDIIFYTKNFIKNFIESIINIISFPILNHKNIKNNFVPKKVSEDFPIYFLIMVARNLENYRDNFEQIFKDTEKLTDLEREKINDLIDFSLSYYILSEDMQNYDFFFEFNLFNEISEESFKELQTARNEVKKIMIENRNELVKYIQEEMYYVL